MIMSLVHVRTILFSKLVNPRVFFSTTMTRPLHRHLDNDQQAALVKNRALNRRSVHYLHAKTSDLSTQAPTHEVREIASRAFSVNRVKRQSEPLQSTRKKKQAKKHKVPSSTFVGRLTGTLITDV